MDGIVDLGRSWELDRQEFFASAPYDLVLGGRCVSERGPIERPTEATLQAAEVVERLMDKVWAVVDRRARVSKEVAAPLVKDLMRRVWSRIDHEAEQRAKSLQIREAKQQKAAQKLEEQKMLQAAYKKAKSGRRFQGGATKAQAPPATSPLRERVKLWKRPFETRRSMFDEHAEKFVQAQIAYLTIEMENRDLVKYLTDENPFRKSLNALSVELGKRLYVELERLQAHYFKRDEASKVHIRDIANLKGKIFPKELEASIRLDRTLYCGDELFDPEAHVDVEIQEKGFPCDKRDAFIKKIKTMVSEYCGIGKSGCMKYPNFKCLQVEFSEYVRKIEKLMKTVARHKADESEGADVNPMSEELRAGLERGMDNSISAFVRLLEHKEVPNIYTEMKMYKLDFFADFRSQVQGEARKTHSEAEAEDIDRSFEDFAKKLDFETRLDQALQINRRELVQELDTEGIVQEALQGRKVSSFIIQSIRVSLQVTCNCFIGMKGANGIVFTYGNTKDMIAQFCEEIDVVYLSPGSVF